MYALTQSADEQVRLRACQWWTARRMGPPYSCRSLGQPTATMSANSQPGEADLALRKMTNHIEALGFAFTQARQNRFPFRDGQTRQRFEHG